MTFTVTYREKNGAKAEVEIEAANRAGRSKPARRIDQQRALCRLLRHPCRRAAYRAPIYGCERIGKTASCGETWRDVAVECRVAAEFVADALLRVEHKNGNSDVVANGFHDGCQIGIARDEDKAVGTSFVCVAKHRVRDVHVRHLLRDAKHLDATIGASLVAGSAGLTDRGKKFGLFAIAAFDDLDERPVGKCVEILPLPLGMALVGGFVDYARREVLDGNDRVVWIEQLGGECLKVKPFVGGASELSVVEVACVDVDDRVFHSLLLKVQEPGLRPALRRLPESRRVKRPVIGGVRKYSKSLVAAQGGRAIK